MSSRGRSEVLETAILGLLEAKPMHGYELRKHLNVMFGTFRALSYGSLYPALKSLVARNWIRELDELGAPENVLTGRRARIVYELTPAGRSAFATILATCGPTTWEDEHFGVRFAFFSKTDAETRIRILEGRRARLGERIDAISQGQGRIRSRIDEYTLELQRYGLEQVEREVAWLDGLLDTERGTRLAAAATTSKPPTASTDAPQEHESAIDTEKERR